MTISSIKHEHEEQSIGLNQKTSDNVSRYLVDGVIVSLYTGLRVGGGALGAVIVGSSMGSGATFAGAVAIANYIGVNLLKKDFPMSWFLPLEAASVALGWQVAGISAAGAIAAEAASLVTGVVLPIIGIYNFPDDNEDKKE